MRNNKSIGESCLSCYNTTLKKEKGERCMAEKSNTEMSPLCIGILAHVDAGKTTLSEALLYTAGALRRLGRVDHADAFLDTDPQERERGITIFSKQARRSMESGSTMPVTILYRTAPRAYTSVWGP